MNFPEILSTQAKDDSSKISAVILAGGLGARIKHLLPHLPKPMAVVSGRAFLDWILAYLQGQGIHEAVLSTGYLAEMIETYYAKNPPGGIRVQCVRESMPLGTAGGFFNACAGAKFDHRVSAWLVLNGDSLLVTPLKPLLDLENDPRADGGLLAVELEDASRFGTLETDGNGWLRQFREKQCGGGLVSTGVYFLKPSIAARPPGKRPLSFETELFPALLRAGRRLRVLPCKASFLDIGTPETLHQADSFVQANASWFEAAAPEA